MGGPKAAVTRRLAPHLDLLQKQEQVFHLVHLGGSVLESLVHGVPGELPAKGPVNGIGQEARATTFERVRPDETRTRVDR